MVFCLGAGIYTDAIVVALKVSSAFRKIFAEGAFNASFLPRFSRILNREGKDAAELVLSDVFSLLLLVLVPFSIIVMAIYPSFLQLLVSGFDVLSEKFKLTVNLGRICFPYLIFISLASLLCGVLNAINRFALPALVHSILSVFTATALIIGYFFNLTNRATSYIVVYFALFSGIAQFGLLLSSVLRHGFRISFRFRCITPPVKDIMKNMIPGIIGAGIWQLNLIVDTMISSYLPTGTITCLNLADRLNQFPLGTLGIALSTVLLPLLSKAIARKEYDRAMQELERGLVVALFLTLFCATVLIALSEQSVAVAFQRGRFEMDQVRVTAFAVTGFAIGLPAYVLTKVFSALYFAAGDTKFPVIFGIFSIILNVIFLLLLVPFWKYFGLTLCTSLSALSMAIMLIYFSPRKMPIVFTKAFWRKILSQGMAAGVTYLFLLELVELFWSQDLGMKSIKWLIYTGFFASAAFVFFVTTILVLYFTKERQWQLWKKAAWS
jgi:putative peptidoglycan lipid II flippase